MAEMPGTGPSSDYWRDRDRELRVRGLDPDDNEAWATPDYELVADDEEAWPR